MNYQTIKVRFQDSFCFVQFYRPESQNAINETMVRELNEVLDLCQEFITVIVLEGSPKVFCLGADFNVIHEKMKNNEPVEQKPDELYDLWIRLATGPYITISHVRGRANAGGVGFVAASDIVIADNTAQFSLSELLFGLFPACVLPFLIRRIGLQKAHYMSVMTKPIVAESAYSWGLIDSCDDNSENLLRKHLLRLKYLSKTGISKYKKYLSQLDDSIIKHRNLAVQSNKEVFSDEENLRKIFQFVENGQF